MKLGNGLGASGVYFLKVFYGWGKLSGRSVMESESALLGCKLQSENVSEPSEECAQVAVFNVCYKWRICSV